MSSMKLDVGQVLPEMILPELGGGEVNLSTPSDPYKWRMIVVYRGKHCPMCSSYLTKLKELLPDFGAIGVEVVVASADPKHYAQAQIGGSLPGLKVCFGMTPEQMRQWGLYISDPRFGSDGRPFSEPALFVVTGNGDLRVVNIGNAPFCRPDLSMVLMGLRFICNPNNNEIFLGAY